MSLMLSYQWGLGTTIPQMYLYVGSFLILHYNNSRLRYQSSSKSNVIIISGAAVFHDLFSFRLQITLHKPHC